MPISIDLDSLSPEERSRLAEVIGCNEAQLNAALRPYAKAALEEYVRMFLGQTVHVRSSDIRVYRLLLIIRHAFPDELPSEQEISRLFQTTATESKSLLRSVLSKYQLELKERVRRTLAEVIEQAQHDEENDLYTFSASAKSTVDELNQMLARHDGTLPQITKKPGTVATYVLRPSSRQCLMQQLGLQL